MTTPDPTTEGQVAKAAKVLAQSFGGYDDLEWARLDPRDRSYLVRKGERAAQALADAGLLAPGPVITTEEWGEAEGRKIRQACSEWFGVPDIRAAGFPAYLALHLRTTSEHVTAWESVEGES